MNFGYKVEFNGELYSKFKQLTQPPTLVALNQLAHTRYSNTLPTSFQFDKSSLAILGSIQFDQIHIEARKGKGGNSGINFPSFPDVIHPRINSHISIQIE